MEQATVYVQYMIGLTPPMATLAVESGIQQECRVCGAASISWSGSEGASGSEFRRRDSGGRYTVPGLWGLARLAPSGI